MRLQYREPFLRRLDRRWRRVAAGLLAASFAGGVFHIAYHYDMRLERVREVRTTPPQRTFDLRPWMVTGEMERGTRRARYTGPTPVPLGETLPLDGDALLLPFQAWLAERMGLPFPDVAVVEGGPGGASIRFTRRGDDLAGASGWIYREVHRDESLTYSYAWSNPWDWMCHDPQGDMGPLRDLLAFVNEAGDAEFRERVFDFLDMDGLVRVPLLLEWMRPSFRRVALRYDREGGRFGILPLDTGTVANQYFFEPEANVLLLRLQSHPGYLPAQARFLRAFLAELTPEVVGKAVDERYEPLRAAEGGDEWIVRIRAEALRGVDALRERYAVATLCVSTRQSTTPCREVEIEISYDGRLPALLRQIVLPLRAPHPPEGAVLPVAASMSSKPLSAYVRYDTHPVEHALPAQSARIDAVVRNHVLVLPAMDLVLMPDYPKVLAFNDLATLINLHQWSEPFHHTVVLRLDLGQSLDVDLRAVEWTVENLASEAPIRVRQAYHGGTEGERR